MRKAKYFVMVLFAVMIVLFIPSISNAATEQTYKDEAQNIEWTYELDDSNNVINLKCNTTSKIGTVKIPDTIEGRTVISLGDEAFRNCYGITEVTIPNTITLIESMAFYDCTGLKSIIIPNSVTAIKNNAFAGCSGLTSITFSEKLTSIGERAFSDCTGLKKVVIPNSVSMIDSNAFRSCSGIKELTLSNSLTEIRTATFAGCSGLISLKLPESVTTIRGGLYGAFEGCKNLQKILIPDTVATIESTAFADCPKLTIYGNDNMVSKQYAEEKKIPFDYIANWDKVSSGNDITAPTVENIEVTYASVLNYSKDANKNMYMVPAQAKLVINVIFSEVIEGTTVPTLTIKFGNGQNIQVTEGTVGGSTITYIYTVKNTDKGVMTTVDYQGGNIKDAAGNAATLSCPALKIQYSSGDFVYANGTATNPDNSENNSNTNNGTTTNGGSNNGGSSNSGSTTNGTTNNGSSNNGTTTNGGTTNNGSNNGTSKENDKTIATGKLPQTGVGIGLSTLLFATIGASIVFYVKNRKYKGI